MFLLRDGLLTLMYKVSLIVLMRFWSSLPTILKFSVVTLWPVMLQWSNIGDGALRCSLNLSPKVLGDYPMYSSSHSTLSHLYLYMTPLLFWIGSWSLGAIRRFLMVVPSLKYTCTPWLLHTFLKLLLSPLWYGTTMCGFWMLSVPVFFLLLLLFFWVWLLDLILILLRAHAGYLHFVRALCKWSSSCFNSWGFEQIVFALWCRVPIRLYLDGNVWWLSQCRYKSVCVGFLYTVVLRLPSL